MSCGDINRKRSVIAVWVGGGSGAGKTTVTHLLAERFGLRLYSADESIRAHSERLNAVAAPLLERFRHMSMDGRWVKRDPVTMYRAFPWFHGATAAAVIRSSPARPR